MTDSNYIDVVYSTEKKPFSDYQFIKETDDLICTDTMKRELALLPNLWKNLNARPNHRMPPEPQMAEK